MSLRILSILLLGTLSAAFVLAGDAPPQKINFGRGANFSADDLPDSKLRTKLKALPAAAYAKAMAGLKKLSFNAADVKNIRASGSGEIYYACGITPEDRAFMKAKAAIRAAAVEPRGVANAPVLIATPPVYHSRPGCPRVVFLDFNGFVVTGTDWNTDYNTTTFDALPFSLDNDYTTFSDAEQLAIKHIWQRVAEDYAPFDVDVTTEQPTMTRTTSRVLITSAKDKNGKQNPDGDVAGGVAYINVFGNSDYVSRSQPAWIYIDNLQSEEDFIAEAASHEMGHNLGLSHDGTSTEQYYGGHGGATEISWGPIMGTGYDRNVSQWSKGEYLNANNFEDDLSIISGKVGYRADDHADNDTQATPLFVVNGTTISSTNPDNDPTNNSPQNKGVIERTADIDVFRFTTGAGPVSLNVNTFRSPSFTHGNNLDIRADIYNSNGVLVTTSDAGDQTGAAVFFSAQPGTYFLRIQGVGAGDPLAATPTGYTEYGSLGQYFISGTIQSLSPDVGLPIGKLNPVKLTTAGGATLDFTVTYIDLTAMNVSTFDGSDIRITGPNGYDMLAAFVSVDTPTNGSPRTATYRMSAPGGTWDSNDNGSYNIALQGSQVANTSGRFVAATTLGTITIAINSGPPTAVDDAATTPNGQAVTVNVLANDIAKDPPFTILILTKPQHGTAVVNQDNTITYTPVPGYAGTDSLVYSLFDIEIESSTATVTFTIPSVSPVITSSLFVNSINGMEFRYKITTTGTNPITLTAAPLPAGTALVGDEIVGFIQPGSYSVTLSASNASGSDVKVLVINTNQILPNSDADGDGFSDEMEVVFGSNPVDATSTPLTVLKNEGGASNPTTAVAVPFSLSNSGLSIKLNFGSLKANRDAITVSGALPVSGDFTSQSQSFAVFVGGAGAYGALNVRGQYTSGDKTVKFKVGKAHTSLGVRNAPFTAQLKGIYANAFADEGLVNAKILRTSSNIVVSVLMGPQYYSTVAPVTYSARENKTGAAKIVRP